MKNVFLSYSSKDLKAAIDLEQRLRGPDLRVWRDKEQLHGGDRWPKRLGEAIASQDCVLLVWSESSAKSDFVEMEWCTAIALRKSIIPCLLDSAPLPPSLAALHGIDIRSMQDAISQIRGSLLKEITAADPDRNASVIEALGRIDVAEAKSALRSVKTLYDQRGWTVHGNVYITIQHEAKPKRPQPEIRAVAPSCATVGDEIRIDGINFGNFDQEHSRVVIGAIPADITNWSPTSIQCAVPAALKPGSYTVGVQIDDVQASAPSDLTVDFFPPETREALSRGEHLLLLVARIQGDADQSMQADLLEQIRLAIDEKEDLRETLIYAAWPEVFAGPNDLRLALKTGKEQRAQLVLFGRMGEGRTFYPRLAVCLPGGRSFSRSEERLERVTARQRVEEQEQHVLSAERIDRPIRLLHFVTGWYRYEKGEYAAARNNFLEVLNGEELTSINQASFRFGAGQSSEMLAHEILERPVRSNADQQQGRDLLREALDHFERAASAYEKSGMKIEEARTYLRLALSYFGLQQGSEHLSKAVEYGRKGLALLDPAEHAMDCFMGYSNLASALEWLADRYSGIEKEDYLDESLAAAEQSEKFVSSFSTDLERVWTKAGIAVIWGNRYRGNRDENLLKAIQFTEEVLPSLRDSKELQGRYVLMLNHLGNCYLNLMQANRAELLNKAQTAFRTGLQLVGPNRFPEYYQLLSGNLSTANAILKSLSTGHALTPLMTLQGPEVANRLNLSILELRKARRFEEALEQAKMLLRWAIGMRGSLNYHAAAAHNFLGTLYGDLDDAQSARGHLYCALVIASGVLKPGDSHFNLVQAIRDNFEAWLARTGRAAEGKLIIEQALSGAVEKASENWRIASELSNTDLPAAIRQYDAALSWFPVWQEVIGDRGRARLLGGDVTGALEDLNWALALNPRDIIALNYRIAALFKAGDLQNALVDCDWILQLQPGDADFQRMRAQVLAELQGGATGQPAT